MMHKTKQISNGVKLLVITQKVDKEDDVLGFFHSWLEKFSQKLEKLYVVCLSRGRCELPQNVEVFSLGKEKGASKIGQFFRLEKFLLKRLKTIDGVFCHMSPVYVFAAFPLAKIFGKRIILWYVHRSLNFKLKLAKIIVDKILTASSESCRLKSKKIEVVGHGIDTEKFKTPAFAKASAGKQNSKFRMLFAGRIAPIKDILTLIEAVDVLVHQQNIKDIKLKIVGGALERYEKEYKKKVKALVAEKKLEDYIEFTGAVSYPQMVKLYQEADVLINLSPTGGMDKAVLEAMSCQVPVLVCNKAFKKEFGPYCNSLLFQEKDVQDLTRKILGLRKLDVVKIGNYLRERVSRNHNLDNLIQKIISQFQR